MRRVAGRQQVKAEHLYRVRAAHAIRDAGRPSFKSNRLHVSSLHSLKNGIRKGINSICSLNLLLNSLSMTSYPDIVRLLDAAVDNADIGAHGPFWRSLSRDGFVAYQVFGQVQLISTDGSGNFSPDDSNLIKALEGRAPFGRDQGVKGARYPRMPARLPTMSTTDIKTIRDWISAGCPA